MKDKIYYWGPFLSKVATVDAIISSATSLNKFFKNLYDVKIINVFGEFNEYRDKLEKKNVELISFKKSKIINLFPNPGYLRSRLLSIYIFFKYFLSLKKLLKEQPPKFLIIHLITSLPLFIVFFFNIKTKVILRISGIPKLNFFRKFFWKVFLKKVYMVTSPTVETRKVLIDKKILDEEKITVLRDPIISPKKIFELRSKDIEENYIPKDFFISIGRLTKQKNFNFLINSFSKILKENGNQNLLIIGEGEDREKLQKLIKNLKLEKNIFLLGYKKNVFKYFYRAKAFILSSLWEDPGFVLVEAAYSNLSIISSDCPNGPCEILDNGKSGFLFKSNNQDDFLRNFNLYLNSNDNELFEKKIKVKKNIREFSYFNHATQIQKIFDEK